MKQRRCLICGDSQYRVGSCPKNRNLNTIPGTSNLQQPQQFDQGKRPPTKARAYALASVDNPEATDVIESKALVHKFICKILFDPGITHLYPLLMPLR